MKRVFTLPALAGALFIASCQINPATSRAQDAQNQPPAAPVETENKKEEAKPGDAKPGDAKPDEKKEEPLNVTMQISQGAAGLGRVVAFAITARNTSQTMQTLTFTSGQFFDITATPEGGKESVWRWAHDKRFTRALRNENLSPGEMKMWTATWDQSDNLGNPLPRGRYVIAAKLAANGGLPIPPVTVELLNGGNVREISPSQAQGTEVTLTPDKQVYRLGETAKFTLTARNLGKHASTLNFMSGKRAEFSARAARKGVFDENLDPVWAGGLGSMFTMRLAMQPFAPGESVTFSGEWDLKSNQGKPVRPGRYAIEGIVTANGGLRAAPVIIEIQK